MSGSEPQKDVKYYPFILGIALSTIFYILLLYFTPRPAFTQLILLFTGLSAGYLYLLYHYRANPPNLLGLILIPAILFRLIALFALPELSDDYFRFIWDGQLLNHGVNPFLSLPRAYMEDPAAAAQLGLTSELFNGLNSPDYYTIYPAVLQGIFYIATLIFSHDIYGAVVVMKGFIFLAELGSMTLLIALLKRFQMPGWAVALYALNPLVIVELCGNLHFEALMIFFLLASIWLLEKGKWMHAAVPFGLAVCSKLLPLMLMPLLIRRLGWGRAVLFGLGVAGVMLICFLPLFDIETVLHLRESVGLYIDRFEFNASIWYVIRAIGYFFVDYNIIRLTGKWLSMAIIVGILVIAWRERKPVVSTLPNAFMWVFMLYFSLATIVHPWYGTTLVAFSILTRFRFPVIWSILLPLTYFTYRTTAYTESLWLVGIEYIILAAWIILELYNQNRPLAVIKQNLDPLNE